MKIKRRRCNVLFLSIFHGILLTFCGRTIGFSLEISSDALQYLSLSNAPQCAHIQQSLNLTLHSNEDAQIYSNSILPMKNALRKVKAKIIIIIDRNLSSRFHLIFCKHRHTHTYTNHATPHIRSQFINSSDAFFRTTQKPHSISIDGNILHKPNESYTFWTCLRCDALILCFCALSSENWI